MATATPHRQPSDGTPRGQPPPRGRSPRRTLLAVAALVVAVVVAGLLWYLGQDAPEAVDIESAAAAVAEEPAEERTDDPTAPAAEPASTAAAPMAGTWAVDTTIGTFSVEDTTGTFVGFRVAEELTTLGAVEAVGRTPDVSGSITVDGTTLTAGEITADLTAIVSDQPRREDAIQRALGTDTNPTGTFTMAGPVELGSELADGEVVTVDVPGTLTIAGVSQDVVAPLQVTRTGDTVVVTGSLDITFADYGVQAPSAPIVVSVEDSGQVELQLYLTRL